MSFGIRAKCFFKLFRLGSRPPPAGFEGIDDFGDLSFPMKGFPKMRKFFLRGFFIYLKATPCGTARGGLMKLKFEPSHHPRRHSTHKRF